MTKPATCGRLTSINIIPFPPADEQNNDDGWQDDTHSCQAGYYVDILEDRPADLAGVPVLLVTPSVITEHKNASCKYEAKIVNYPPKIKNSPPKIRDFLLKTRHFPSAIEIPLSQTQQQGVDAYLSERVSAVRQPSGHLSGRVAHC